MFIGVDISGSFMDGRYFDDSIEFLARYIHAHLNGLGGMEIPNALFVGSIGGVMIVMGVSDYLGRSQYRQRIHELEERRSHLRERMFEVYAAD